MSIAGEVHAALVAAGLDIDGVAIGDGEPKTLWRIDWKGKPSESDMAAAAAVIAGFDPVAAAARVAAVKFLRASDARMARGIEDVIEILKRAGAIKGGELAGELDDLIAARKGARDTLAASRG